jgi:hypothetical protein
MAARLSGSARTRDTDIGPGIHKTNEEISRGCIAALLSHRQQLAQVKWEMQRERKADVQYSVHLYVRMCAPLAPERLGGLYSCSVFRRLSQIGAR